MATTPPIPSSTPPPVGSRAPLWAVLTLTFLGSVGTGIVTTGISFIATQGLDYSKRMNLLLTLALGGSYIAGALLAGRIVRRFTKRHAWLGTRGALALVLVLITLVCQLPLLAARFAPGWTELSFWVLVLVFSPATGLMWPIVESYLSGGRSGKRLRRAIGRFNIVWSGALVAAYWFMAPLLKEHPMLILSILGSLHLVMVVVLRVFPSDPANHIDEDHEHAPESYKPLLRTFRILLIASYVVMSVLSPLLPVVEEKLGIPVPWWTPIASSWLIARVLLFGFFERWHGWHGRWWTPWTGMGLLLLGFATCMLAPSFPNVGMTMLVSGLAIMGIGIAMTYCGALYYALAVESAEIDAGGKHEAFIGLGYTLGPACGLLGLVLAPDDPEHFRLWVIGITSVVVLGAGVLAVRNARA
ncbi:MAG: MFS transporter [Phycisphaerales bacterium]|nr:MFS transporter [Phycisphaerales bacterium]